jgi:hypothetical protein
MTGKQRDFVMHSRGAWDDVKNVDDIRGLTFELLHTLVHKANYKNHKLAFSVRSFCDEEGWRSKVLQRHMRILVDKGYVCLHAAKNQHEIGFVEVLKYDLLVRGAVPPAVPPAVVDATTAQASDQGKPETNGGGKTQDVISSLVVGSKSAPKPQKTAVSSRESELLKGSFEERRAKALAALDEDLLLQAPSGGGVADA